MWQNADFFILLCVFNCAGATNNCLCWWAEWSRSRIFSLWETVALRRCRKTPSRQWGRSLTGTRATPSSSATCSRVLTTSDPELPLSRLPGLCVTSDRSSRLTSGSCTWLWARISPAWGTLERRSPSRNVLRSTTACTVAQRRPRRVVRGFRLSSWRALVTGRWMVRPGRRWTGGTGRRSRSAGGSTTARLGLKPETRFRCSEMGRRPSMSSSCPCQTWTGYRCLSWQRKVCFLGFEQDLSYVMLMMLGDFQRILKDTQRVSLTTSTKSLTIWTIPTEPTRTVEVSLKTLTIYQAWGIENDDTASVFWYATKIRKRHITMCKHTFRLPVLPTCPV